MRLRQRHRGRVIPRQWGENPPKTYASSGGGYASAATMDKWRNDEDFVLGVYRSGRQSAAPLTNLPSEFYGWENITDVVGNPNSYNDVTHRKTCMANYPTLSATKSYLYPDFELNYVPYSREASWNTVSVYTGNLIDHVKHYQDQQFVADAYWAMKPRFEGDVSIINSLFELKDFKDVSKNLFKGAKDICSIILGSIPPVRRGSNIYWNPKNASHEARKAASRLRKAYYKNIHKAGEDPLAAAANGWLLWSLAINPTIRDVTAIIAQSAARAAQAQDEFADRGKDMRRHYSKYHETVSGSYGNYNERFKFTGINLSVRRGITADIRYSYVKRNTIDAFIKYWGLTGNVEAFWNMLPWTFVLDYWLSISKSLNLMRTDENVSQVTYDMGESHKIARTYGMHYHNITSKVFSLVVNGSFKRSTTSGQHLLVSGHEDTLYQRRTIQTYYGPVLPKWKLPSPNQGLTMLALAKSLLS